MAVVWPQLVFFGPALYWKDGGPALPHAWASIASWVFWLTAAAAYGLATRNVHSIAIAIVMALLFAVAVTLSIRFLLPVVGMRALLEFP
jgi:hypothetical protein